MHQGAGGRGPPRDGPAGTAGGGADRVSALPDSVCYRIFSFLKAWEVVRTSQLSRRWRDLWATAPRLDIRQRCACDARADQKKFDDFIKNLLLKRRALNAPLDTLRLCWSHDGHANTWISYAIRRGARVIELSGKHHHGYPLPEYTSFISGNLKILKFTHVGLLSNTLTQLCSRCTSLEELELKDCSLIGTEIRSTPLKRLAIINCTIPSGLLVNAPNLLLLRCIRPFSHVPQIENLESLVTATIMLDDSCLRHGREWPQVEDNDDDESDHDDDFFAYSGAEDSDDNNNSESDDDDDDDFFPYAGAEDPDENNGSESDHEYDDGDHYHDSEWSEPCDKNGDDLEDYDDRTVTYGEIADEYSSKDGPSDDYGGGHGSNDCIIYGGDGILRGLSNVRTMDLLAQRGEVLLRRELKRCPKFKNLKTLSLGEWCMAPDFDALSIILERSPDLENLFLHLDMVRKMLTLDECLLREFKHMANPLNEFIVSQKAYDSREGIDPRGRSFACRNLKVVKITCSKDDIMVHKLAQFFIANGVPLEKIFARRTTSTRNGKGGRGSSAKRKAQGEAAKRAAKQRKARNSGSPE